MNQNQAILKHLKKHRKITPLEALRLYGVFRLSGRVLELRQAGNRIKTTIIEVSSERGKKRVAEYSLVKGIA